MLKLAPLKAIGSSVEQMDIESVVDGVIRLSGNNYRSVVVTNSINFELKSEAEQDTLIDIFEGFLNSIGFPIQFLIRTREIDMDSYLGDLNVKITDEESDIYKQQLKHYRKFITTLISSNKILNRQFYVVIPVDITKKSETSTIKEQLALRIDIITKNLARLGISCRQLNSIEVIDLFYSFYSPLRSKLQPISEEAINLIDSEFVVSRGNRSADN